MEDKSFSDRMFTYNIHLFGYQEGGGLRWDIGESLWATIFMHHQYIILSAIANCFDHIDAITNTFSRSCIQEDLVDGNFVLLVLTV